MSQLALYSSFRSASLRVSMVFSSFIPVDDASTLHQEPRSRPDKFLAEGIRNFP